MSDELNELLKDKWVVIDRKGDFVVCVDEDDAHKSASRWDAEYRSSAPHHAVQLQVKGTLPEGAIMPKYKVGDRVGVSLGTKPYIVESIEAAYRLEGAFGTYGDDHISLAPPADPMRDEFEALAAKQKCDISRLNDQSEIYTNIYTQGMWDGYQAAKAGAK